MFKILVVEDEPSIARTICQLIAKVSSSFEIAGIAYDGQTALHMIPDCEPDLVITDVKMPMMDGLELSKAIQNIYPNIKVCILSCYGEFNYAVTAMQAGVIDYLLKPITKEALSSLLEKMKKQLELEQYTAQQAIWNGLLHHNRKNVSGEAISKYFPYGTYLVLYSCLGSYLHVPVEIPDCINKLEKSNYLYTNAWNYFPDNTFWIVNGYRPNEKIMIIACTKSEVKELKDRMQTMVHTLSANEIPISAAATVCENLPENIANAALSLHQHIKTHTVFSRSSFWNYGVHSGTEDCSKNNFVISYKDEKYLKTLFKERSYDNLGKAIDKLLAEAKEHGVTQLDLENMLSEILRVLLECLGNSLTLSEYQNTVYEITGYNYRYPALSEAFHEIVASLAKINDSNYFDHIPQNVLAQQIRKYLEENYTQPITLKTLASTFGMVAPYLSKIYMNYYGTSIKNDLLDLRMKKAKELLKVIPAIPLKEIADLCGFNDQFYFSKVFKKYNNMNPVDFRKFVNNEP